MNGCLVLWTTEKMDCMTRHIDSTQKQEKPPERQVSENRIRHLRKNLGDPGYMNDAVQRLAQELSIEWMETTYGIPFR